MEINMEPDNVTSRRGMAFAEQKYPRYQEKAENPYHRQEKERILGGETTPKELRILVIGKTGTGKSSLCNTIVGSDVFKTGRSFQQVTTRTQEASTVRFGMKITVIDTPDVSEEAITQQKDRVEEWQSTLAGCDYMVLLTVRCDSRYSPGEYEIYKGIRKLWGRQMASRLVVAFTFADTRGGESVDMDTELNHVWPELKTVMRDAGNRYVVFNNEPGNMDTEAVEKLLGMVPQVRKAGQTDVIHVLGLLMESLQNKAALIVLNIVLIVFLPYVYYSMFQPKS